MSPDTDGSWQHAWEAALAGLELDLHAAEALLHAVHDGTHDDLPAALGSWTPPAGIGPLPATLAERAQLVLERQIAVIEQIAHATTRSRQHLEMQRRMADRAPSRPLFVDAAF